LKLYDDHNIRHINQSSDRFLYSPQNQKPSTDKKRTSEGKKYYLLSESIVLFEEEPIEFNDLDSNMLNRNIVKFLPTDSLRLELQMERAEKKIRNIDEEIKACEILEMQEIANEEFLKKSKKRLLQKISSYKSEYRELGFIYKIADMFSEAKTELLANYNYLKNLIFTCTLSKRIFEKMPGYAEKQKIIKLNLVQKKLFSEINKKNIRVDTKRLEYLFLKKEKISGIN